MKTWLLLASIGCLVGFANPAKADFKIFNGHYYTFTNTAQNWLQAEAIAVGLGGHLVAVNDLAEQTFLTANFAIEINANRPLWIGLTDAGSEFGIFHWSTGQPVTFTNWNPGQPDYGSGVNYVAMNWDFAQGSTTVKGTWNDLPLDGTAGLGGNTDGPYFGIVELNFDPTAVPAPTNFILGGLGIILIGASRRFATRRAIPHCTPLGLK